MCASKIVLGEKFYQLRKIFCIYLVRLKKNNDNKPKKICLHLRKNFNKNCLFFGLVFFLIFYELYFLMKGAASTSNIFCVELYFISIQVMCFFNDFVGTGDIILVLFI